VELRKSGRTAAKIIEGGYSGDAEIGGKASHRHRTLPKTHRKLTFPEDTQGL